MTASSPTRASFRAALAAVQRYVVDLDQPPAFLTPVEALGRLEQPPLPDLPAPRPRSTARVEVSIGLDPRLYRDHKTLTVAEAARQIAQGSVSAVELAHDALQSIAQREEELNAFVYVLPEKQVLAQAEQLDREQRAGRLRGPLHGIPIAVKDVIAVAGMPNTASSRVLADVIADRDATSVRRLREAGAIIMGKTQTFEFALGVTTPQSRNPWNPTHDPGGSSGGSAIAVVTGMSLAALGTDTRASIRVPSALCGIVGFKPTFGLVPTDGVITLSWSLDHVGPMTRTVEDAAILLNMLVSSSIETRAGSHPPRSQDYTQYLSKDIRGLRIGVPVHALEDAAEDVVTVFQNSVEAFRSFGVEVVETDTPLAEDFDMAALMGLIVSRCEAATYHRAFSGKESLYSTPVYEQLDEASRVPAVAYLQAQRCRAAFRSQMLEQLSQLDALLMPTCRVPAPRTTEVEKYFLVLSYNCIPWSFIGFPAVSVPGGFTPAGLPVGVQLVAGPLEDGRLLALASALESALAA
jgi:aspartyl-tRNA(Asn)/glutamyl-tRNA(Gln) amidotransferase subunit A